MMTSKIIVFALVAIFAQALAVPVAKDLAADIEDAKLRVSFFDIEVVEMINRINIMDIELGLPVEDLASGVIENLREIGAEPAAVDKVINSFTQFARDHEENSRELRQILAQQMRTTLNTIYNELDGNMNELPINTDVLKAEIANAEVVFDKLFQAITEHATSADFAITEAVNGVDGATVLEIYTDWQTVLDILLNQQYLTTNVKIVFDSRGQDAVDALEVIIGQTP